MLVSGGGTGGHIYPAIAIAKEVEKNIKGTKVIFIGTQKGLEASVVPRQGIEFVPITVEGVSRSFSLRSMVPFLKMFVGLWDSLRILMREKPDVVLGTGGYVCGPVVLGAVLLRIPALLHESNLRPGITVRLLAPFVKKVLVSFEETKASLRGKAEVVGTPISPEILNAQRQKAYETFGFDKEKFTVFVVGGSQGAHSINVAMLDALTFLRESELPLQVLFMTGFKDYQFVLDECEKKAIKPVVKSFLYNMPEAYAVADLVISRAGAMTIAELTAKGLPAILIPYPYAAHDHQTRNAELLMEKGAAVVVKNGELSGMALSLKIRELLKNEQKLKSMGEASKRLGKADAGKKIVEEIKKLVVSRN